MLKPKWGSSDVGPNGWELDGEDPGPAARSYSPLIANWRRRIRGERRRPIRPNGSAATSSLEPLAEWSPLSTSGGDAAADPRDATSRIPRRQKSVADSPVVLPFPGIVLPPTAEPPAPTAEPPAPRARGPLSWAYWSAQRS